MAENTLHLLSMGHFHPENVLDNVFLESLDIGADADWIIERVGIRKRRTILPLDYIRLTKNSDLRAADEAAILSNAETGAKAAMMALQRANLAPADIGMVIAGGCSPQHSTPAEACAIAAHLGMECRAFDLNSACTSFATQIYLLSGMKAEFLPDYILLVNAENNTRKVDYRDRRTAVLWGDASTAAIVSPRLKSHVAVSRTVLHSEPAGWNKVVIPSTGYFRQDGLAVQSFAIRKTLSLIEELLPERASDGSHFVGHQANLLMLEAVCRKACISIGEHWFNVDRYGNCGASGAPAVISERWETLPPGQLCVALVGSGLTWGGFLLTVHGNQ